MADDIQMIIGGIAFAVAALAFFIVGLVTGNVKGLKQEIRWALALLAMVGASVAYFAMAQDQPQYPRDSDSVLVVWGRFTLNVVTQTLVAAVVALGIYVQTRNLILLPLLVMLTHLMLLFGVLPDAGKTSMKHYMFLIFAAVFWVFQLVVQLIPLLGIGADSEEEAAVQAAVFQTKSFAYRKWFVVTLVVVLWVIQALYILFWAFDPAVGHVWSLFWSALMYLILDVLVVGVIVFLVFYLHNPEKNPALESGRSKSSAADLRNLSSEATEEDDEEEDDEQDDEEAPLASSAAPSAGQPTGAAAIQSQLDSVLGGAYKM